MFENADLIHRYTRADAIRDGVLIDVSATAREASGAEPGPLPGDSHWRGFPRSGRDAAAWCRGG